MTSLLSAWHPLVVHATGPSWDLLRQRVARSRCSLEGAAALDQAIGSLEQLLGPSWPRRQYERHGWWPGELNLLGFHVAALPQFLTLVTRLLTAAQEPTFSKVLQALKRGVTGDGWRHAMLQLEVARALRGPGTCITFEPAIPGSSNRADLLVARPGGSSFLVETTTLARAKADLDWEEYENHVFQAVAALEVRYGIRVIVRLTDRPDIAVASQWIDAIEHAARFGEAENPRVIESAAGRAEIWPVGSQGSDLAFAGAALTRDGWHRLGRAVHGKARQSTGPLPVWLRIDALDGFFQFTEWAHLDWSERIDRAAAALRHDLASANAEHLAGIILSSSATVSLGATGSANQNETIRTEQGNGIRRLIADHMVRETAVIALREDAHVECGNWTTAYSAEPTWLLEDLCNQALPPLEAFMPG
ncbi:hypothetical protein [Amycolatopsis pigmentata]|uniref:PD-(D/E)XK nuclease superfamily protein n=1 Tax=Amycolatopsis pigmentata TaxID=450801 RepID=A0ABW5G503_9PSEU